MTAMTQPRDGGDMKWPNAFRLLADHSTQVSLTYVVRRHIGLDFRRLLVGASKPRCCWWSIDHKLWIIQLSTIYQDYLKWFQEIKFHQISKWPWYRVLSYFWAGRVHDMTYDTSNQSITCEPVHLGNTSCSFLRILFAWVSPIRAPACRSALARGQELEVFILLGVKLFEAVVWICLNAVVAFHIFFCRFPLLFPLLLVLFVVCPTIVYQGLGFLCWSCLITSALESLEEPKPPIWDKDQAGQQSWEVVSSQMESRSS